MPFKIGDKVVLRRREDAGAFFAIGKEYIIEDVGIEQVKVQPDDVFLEAQWVREDRFKLAEEPAVRKFVVGDRVRVPDIRKNHDAVRIEAVIGREFTLSRVADREGMAGAPQKVMLAFGPEGWWHSDRFALVAEQVPAPAWVNPFQIPPAQPMFAAIDGNADAELANAIMQAPIALPPPAQPKFKVGDKVRLTGMNGVDGPGWFPRFMDGIVGQEFTIRALVKRWNDTVSYKFEDPVQNRDYEYDEAWLELVDEWVVGAKIHYGMHANIYKDRMENCPVYVITEIDGDQIRIQALPLNIDMGYFHKGSWVLAGKQEKAVPKKKEEPQLDPVKQAEKIEKMLKGCREKLVKNSGGCANFYLIKQKKNGDLVKVGGTAQPCHYELRGGYEGMKGEVPVAVIDSISCREDHLDEHKKQGFKDYVNYLLNRSPWSIAYKTKTYEEAVANCIDMNIDVTANIMVGACIAMRQSSEYSDVLPVHAFLKAKRFSGDVCFLIGQHYTINHRGEFVPLNINSGHSILTTTMPADELFKFFATKEFVGEADKKPYREHMAYNNIFGSLTGKEEYARAKAGEVSIQDWMHKNCPMEETGRGFDRKQVVTEANILKLARLVKAELSKYKQAVEA
jgi:hypothetical protein